MTRTALVWLLLTGCGDVAFEGDWLGVCEAGEGAARVQARVSKDDGTLTASVLVNRPERPDVNLSVFCTDVEERGKEVGITGCRGTWEGVDTPNDLSLSGEMDARDPVPVMVGDCQVDGLAGELELWRIP